MNIYDQLHALAKEIDANVAQVQKVAGDTARQQTRLPIPGGLGSVTVTGGGQLVSVDLDRRGLGATNGAALGRQVVQAIREAESRAMDAKKQRIDAVQRRYD
ncbi:YbaB/EbfC family nucleoid-associated protein [Saccharopolyspora sp. 5N708]|uniref:YbaB/EbfC family nucleoid-associated protein n=1 Tax=Saccharopolyspora sp. 5N708 TaxID=3457424 RepID=UPI003FD10BB8